MVSNAITIFRTLLTLPLFVLLAFGGNAWAALALFLGAARWRGRATRRPRSAR
jgi:phosphatidylglycerophosphate synthase